MEKLISLSDFVKIHEYPTTQEEAQSEFCLINNFFEKVTKYNDFLKKPLTLSMFVPCDENGNIYVNYHSYQPQSGTVCEPYQGLFEVSKKGKDVELLNEPQFWKEDQRYYNKRKYDESFQKYQEAKKRVLFEGFEIKDNYLVWGDVWLMVTNIVVCYTIEEILTDFEDVELILTESAKQQLS